MENELITTKTGERAFSVSFKKIKMHRNLIKLSKVLERQSGVYAKKPIKNFGDCDLTIYYERNRDVVAISLSFTNTVIKPMLGNATEILASNFYDQKEIIQTALEILPSWVKTQYLFWREGIF